MGKKPDELEREIAQHRQSMTRKVDELKERVTSDAAEARSIVGEDIVERTKLRENVEQRPFVTVATALGAGLVAGAITGGGSKSPKPAKPPRSQASSSPGSEAAGSGLVAGLLSTVTGKAGATLQEELRQAIDDFFGRGTAGQEKMGAATDGARPAPTFTDHLAPTGQPEHTPSSGAGSSADAAERQATRLRTATSNVTHPPMPGMKLGVDHENGNGGTAHP